jgi:putative membrane protein
VENYGTGMTPFYTNLALWVGGLILVSILKQEVDRDKEVPDFTPTSAYFGRILLFLIIGLIQGAIVCAGDIILLKVQCLHPVKFILAGMLTSFVYVNLIFALASTFKHMGKALAVLLVILQIPGSSGTYPIEMMPEFFQRLHPLLPFSYSISAMRECIAGYYHHTYRSGLGKLLVFLLVALFIGLVLRPLLMNLNHLFDVRLAETDLMICETDSKGRDNPQLQRIMQVIMKDDAWRKKLTEKTLAFEKYYPVMVRSGFICMMVIPLVFLILMFSLESKLVYLILWIVSLLALILYLLIVEYLHEEMKKKSVLGEMSSEELMKILKEENNK